MIGKVVLKWMIDFDLCRWQHWGVWVAYWLGSHVLRWMMQLSGEQVGRLVESLDLGAVVGGGVFGAFVRGGSVVGDAEVALVCLKQILLITDNNDNPPRNLTVHCCRPLPFHKLLQIVVLTRNLVSL